MRNGFDLEKESEMSYIRTPIYGFEDGELDLTKITKGKWFVEDDGETITINDGIFRIMVFLNEWNGKDTKCKIFDNPTISIVEGRLYELLEEVIKRNGLSQKSTE